MTECHQLLPFVEDPICYRFRQSNTQAEAERELPAQRGFNKPQTSQVVGMSGYEPQIQIGGGVARIAPKAGVATTRDR